MRMVVHTRVPGTARLQLGDSSVEVSPVVCSMTAMVPVEVLFKVSILDVCCQPEALSRAAIERGRPESVLADVFGEERAVTLDWCKGLTFRVEKFPSDAEAVECELCKLKREGHPVHRYYPGDFQLTRPCTYGEADD